MFRRLLVIMVFIAVIVTGSSFAEMTMEPFDITYSLGVYAIDYEQKIIYVPDTYSNITMYSPDFDSFVIYDQEGNVIDQNIYYELSDAHKITFSLTNNDGNHEVVFDVVHVDEYFTQIDRQDDFLVTLDSRRFYKINPTMTYGEVLASLELSEGVTHYYVNSRNERIGDMSQKTVGDYPHILRFVRDGVIFEPDMRVFYDLTLNGYQARKYERNYYFPLDEVVDADELLKKLCKENPELKQTFFTNRYQGNIDVKTENNYINIMSHLGSIYSAYFVPSNKYDFEKVDVDSVVIDRAYHLGEAVVSYDESIFSLVDGRVNRIFVKDAGLSIDQFINGLEVIDGYHWKFYDAKTKKPVFDYSLPICSDNAMKVYLTNDIDAIPVYVYFELDYGVKPNAPFTIEDHRIIAQEINGIDLKKHIVSEYFFGTLFVSSPLGQVGFFFDGPYMNIIYSHDSKAAIKDYTISEKQIPNSNYSEGSLTQFKLEGDKLVRDIKTTDSKKQILGIFNFYTSLEKVSSLDMIKYKMLYPYAEAVLNDADNAVKSIARTEFLSYIKAFTKSYQGDVDDYVTMFKYQIRLLDELLLFNSNMELEIAKMRSEVISVFVSNGVRLDEQNVNVDTILKKQQMIRSMKDDNINIDQNIIINLSSNVVLTQEMMKALEGSDVTFKTRLGNKRFSANMLSTLKGDITFSIDTKSIVIAEGSH